MRMRCNLRIPSYNPQWTSKSETEWIDLRRAFLVVAFTCLTRTMRPDDEMRERVAVPMKYGSTAELMWSPLQFQLCCPFSIFNLCREEQRLGLSSSSSTCPCLDPLVYYLHITRLYCPDCLSSGQGQRRDSSSLYTRSATKLLMSWHSCFRSRSSSCRTIMLWELVILAGACW